jgi:hypothetical protein
LREQLPNHELITLAVMQARAASYLVTYMIRVWRGTPRRGTTMCGWRTRATSGDCACTWSGEQETLLDIFTAEPRLLVERPGQTLIGDKNYFGADFQTQLAQTGAVLLRPAANAA